jgi:hypothetical protein
MKRRPPTQFQRPPSLTSISDSETSKQEDFSVWTLPERTSNRPFMSACALEALTKELAELAASRPQKVYILGPPPS